MRGALTHRSRLHATLARAMKLFSGEQLAQGLTADGDGVTLSEFLSEQRRAEIMILRAHQLENALAYVRRESVVGRAASLGEANAAGPSRRRCFAKRISGDRRPLLVAPPVGGRALFRSR